MAVLDIVRLIRYFITAWCANFCFKIYKSFNRCLVIFTTNSHRKDGSVSVGRLSKNLSLGSPARSCASEHTQPHGSGSI